MIIYDQIWSHMIFGNDDHITIHIWSSCMNIIYDDHIWSSCMMISCDDRDQDMGRDRERDMGPERDGDGSATSHGTGPGPRHETGPGPGHGTEPGPGKYSWPFWKLPKRHACPLGDAKEAWLYFWTCRRKPWLPSGIWELPMFPENQWSIAYKYGAIHIFSEKNNGTEILSPRHLEGRQGIFPCKAFVQRDLYATRCFADLCSVLKSKINALNYSSPQSRVSNPESPRLPLPILDSRPVTRPSILYKSFNPFQKFPSFTIASILCKSFDPLQEFRSFTRVSKNYI